MTPRLALAVLLPLLALALQWLLWRWIDPFVWFLFFPAVFYSARLAGLWGGLGSTLLSVLMVVYFFIPPQLSWQIADPNKLYSVAMFLAMGGLFSDSQERLRRAKAHADAALAETRSANERLGQLYKRMVELDELKTRFFTHLSHELRTPLTLIMAPLLQRLGAPEGDPAAQRSLAADDKMMLRNARTLYRHVNDLLDVAKLEAGQLTLRYAQLDLGALLRALAAQFESNAQQRGITLDVDVPPDQVLEADSACVHRIVLNLLSNAFKFTPDGGRITLRCRTVAGARKPATGAEVDPADPLDQVLIEVCDSGPGVPAAQRAAVFERFHQIEDSTGQRAGGTGLGLAIVKEFTELHQGQVDVNEAPGGGALFTVRLPRRAAPGSVVAAKGCTAALDPWMDDTLCIDEPAERAAAATPGPAPLQPAGPGASADALRQAGAAQAWQAPLVLVVEDNTDLNNYIADALRPHYRVACAYDGQDGLALALALRPDLILCDLMMPRLDGAGLVARLRREGALADVPIVVLTARADEGLRVRLLQQGVQDYLDKPFAVDELLARVAGLIRSRQRSRSELERYEQIVATSGDMLCLVDQQRRFVVTNPAYAALFGRTPHDLQLRPVAEAIGAGNYARILPHLDRAFAGAVERFTITPDLPDGQRRVLDVEYRPFVQQGEVRGVVAILRDVTTLADSRAALQRRSEELAERNAELERFNRASIGRELDMIQLKQRVNTMSTQLGQAKPFDLAFIDGADLPGALRTPS